MAWGGDRLKNDQAEPQEPPWRTASLLLIPLLAWAGTSQATCLLTVSNKDWQCHIDQHSLVACRLFVFLIGTLPLFHGKHCQFSQHNHVAGLRKGTKANSNLRRLAGPSPVPSKKATTTGSSVTPNTRSRGTDTVGLRCGSASSTKQILSATSFERLQHFKVDNTLLSVPPFRDTASDSRDHSTAPLLNHEQSNPPITKDIADRVLISSLTSPLLRETGAGTRNSKTSPDGDRSSKNQSDKPTGTPSKKRKRLGSDTAKKDPEDPSDDDGEPSDAGAPSKHPSDDGEFRGLKCPFYQRRPEAHQRDSCKVKSYKTMARLKQHIERVHTKPIQCDRCWKDMPSKEALKQHIKMDPICDNVDRPTDDDRVCKQWLKNLNLNQLPFSQATCPSKKWNMLYDKIFPGEGDMPECYEEPGMTAAEKRRFLQLLAEKLATECGTEISQRFPILVQECKQEMHGMGKHMPQDKAEGIGKTQLLSLPPNPLSPPWTTVAPDRTHELCIWETPAPVAQQPYQAHLDPDIEAEVKKPSTPYLPWTDWPDASPGIEYGIDDLVQHSKNAEPAKSKDEGDDHVPISGFRESSGELPELHASNDDDAIFEAFVQYPPDQYPPDQGPLEEPRDGG